MAINGAEGGANISSRDALDATQHFFLHEMKKNYNIIDKPAGCVHPHFLPTKDLNALSECILQEMMHKHDGAQAAIQRSTCS